MRTYHVKHPEEGFDVLPPARRPRSSTSPIVAEQQRRTLARDHQLVGMGLDALLAMERADLLAWAHTFLVVGGCSFTGTVDHLRRLHASVPMARVARLLQLEHEVSETRKRMGIA